VGEDADRSGYSQGSTGSVLSGVYLPRVRSVRRVCPTFTFRVISAIAMHRLPLVSVMGDVSARCHVAFLVTTRGARLRTETLAGSLAAFVAKNWRM
jgi:hypothetical protein